MKADAASRRSLRHAIAEALRERIAGERLAAGRPAAQRARAGARARRLAASLRAAIALLEEDGLVRRLHGSGTYVTHRPGVRNDLSRNFGVSSLIAAMGLEPGSTVGRVRARSRHRRGSRRRSAWPAGARERAAPRAHRGRPAGRRRDRLVPARRAVARKRWRSWGGSIYAALAERGLPVHHGVATIEPATAEATSPGGWACRAARCC